MVVPGCLVGEQCCFCICCICKLGKERIVPYSVVGLPTFFVFLLIFVWARHSCVGPQSGERCWPLLARLWRAVAPLMKPWCAEGDVPTAANLNLYRGWRSCVGWHSDDEPLFGERGEAKLIVPVSFRTPALFKWKGKSCPSNEGNSCWLGHGDVLMELVEKGSFGAFWLLLGALCILGVLALLVIPLVCTGLGSHRCASCWTRPVLGEFARKK